MNEKLHDMLFRKPHPLGSFKEEKERREKLGIKSCWNCGREVEKPKFLWNMRGTGEIRIKCRCKALTTFSMEAPDPVEDKPVAEDKPAEPELEDKPPDKPVEEDKPPEKPVEQPKPIDKLVSFLMCPPQPKDTE